MTRRLIVGKGPKSLTAALVLVLAGCGGGDTSTSPSGSGGPEAVIVQSGRTEQPIPSLAGLTAVFGQTLRLGAPGFFSLNTTYAGAPILLWPADDGFLSAAHTRRIIYSGADPGKLTRLAPGVTAVSLVPDAGIRAFPWALNRVVKAAETLSVSHPALDFAVDGPGSRVDLIVDFTDPVFAQQPGAAGAAYVYTDGSTITRAKVVYRSLQIAGFWYLEENFETAVVHEVIHTTGLNHSSGTEDPPGVMSDTSVSYQIKAPTERERLIMKMQYSRVPGTTLAGMTESDPGVSARTSEPQWRLVCVF